MRGVQCPAPAFFPVRWPAWIAPSTAPGMGGTTPSFWARCEGTVLQGDDADLAPLLYFKGYKAVGDAL